MERVCADPTFDLHFVPVSVYWGRAPRREGSFFKLAFAQDWALTSRASRVLTLLFNGRNTLVQFGSPLSARALAGGEPSSPAVRKVSRALAAQLAAHRAAQSGPDLSHRRTLMREVLMTRAVRAAVAQAAGDEPGGRRKQLMNARALYEEIAANYSHAFAQFMANILRRVWTRIYDGVEFAHASTLHDVAAGNEIIYVPSHRSHMDDMLLPYAIYREGFAVPHIAAGINLDLPVIGKLMRKGGAFFLRRSFRGNALYTVVFMKYLATIMARGHSITYFIEGGRSRTGRLLSPKTGMLSMTIRSYLREPVRPVVFVPVYFGYERIMEGEGYVDELSGEAEGEGDLPRAGEVAAPAARTLRPRARESRRTDPSRADPRPREPRLAHAVPGRERPRGLDQRSGRRERAFDHAQHQRRGRGHAGEPDRDRAARDAAPAAAGRGPGRADRPLFAAAATTAVFVARDGDDAERRGDPDLRTRSQDPRAQRIGRLDARPRARAGGADAVLPQQRAAPLRAAVAARLLLHRQFEPADGRPAAARVAHLSLHRLRAVPALGRSGARAGGARRAHGADGARPAELRCRDADLASARGRHRRGDAALLLAQATIQTIERYYLAIAVLIKCGSGVVSASELEKHCKAMLQRMDTVYGFSSPEFADRSLFEGFIALLRRRGVVRSDAEGKLVFDEVLERVAADGQLVLSEALRHSVLQLVHD